MIPREVQGAIYEYASGITALKDELTDQSMLVTEEWMKSYLIVRDCALYILLITTGMRLGEALSVEREASREEMSSEVTWRWVRAKETKTGRGNVEFLCPQITLDVLKILDPWSRVLQRSMLREADSLRGSSDPSSILRLDQIKADENKLFMQLQRSNWRASALSPEAANKALKRLTESAGVKWAFASRQTRRTYARLVAESGLGVKSLPFLKWQLNHSSLEITQGYASNPLADRTLFQEFFEEEQAFKFELFDRWASATPLSGGGGRTIVHHRMEIHGSRAALLKSAAITVNVRATGHGWCLAQTRGCGGAGLYEATRCVDCKSGVIELQHAETWLGIHAQTMELAELGDVGEAVRARALREVRLAETVLKDLGIDFE